MTENETNGPARERGFPWVLGVLALFPILGLLAAAVLFVSGGPATTDAAATPPAITLPPPVTPVLLRDKLAPDFSLNTLEQTRATLSDYRGRVVFLNFWATWCVPCQRELPAFEQFMQAQGDDGPVVLGVNLGETFDTVNAYLDELKIGGFPILLDVNYEASDKYGIGPIPVTFVIDADGVIRFSKYGEMKPADMTGYLDALKLPAADA